MESHPSVQLRLTRPIIYVNGEVIAWAGIFTIEKHKPTLVLPHELIVRFGRFILAQVTAIPLGCPFRDANGFCRGKTRFRGFDF